MAVSEVVATSHDGRTFTFWCDGAPGIGAGDMVVALAAGGVTVLGQVLDVTRPAGTPGARGGAGHSTGTGVVIGTIADDLGLERGARPAFEDAPLVPAAVDHLAALHGSGAASMTIGTWRTGDVGADAKLRASGFNRHTFLCGQSGSGKTYALGVLLERLILQTDLRIAVLDPNADFVHLGRTLPGVPEEAGQRIAERGVRVLRSDSTRSGDAEPLRLRFRTMTRAAQAAVLRLDPIRDQEEYNAFVGMLATLGQSDLGNLLVNLRAGTEAQQRLARRMENLGLTEWEAWARDLPSAADVVTGAPGVTVMDLGGFGDPMESTSIALEVVDELWAQRDRRVPTLVVIDEAHNLCRSDPTDPVATLLLERIIQIAAEGRKYGLWLLLSSQRPSKIHPQILSQCDNLMLMRMNSPDDIVELGRTFGFAPQPMLRASTGFVQGEALLAGGFAPVPMLVQMRERLTAQGGSDVAVPLVSTNG
ncbi:MAG TPA: ATP-binding protein [Ornithinibacter sp.]|nr:ATP-binding protein [Ornithinibacter sp.]